MMPTSPTPCLDAFAAATAYRQGIPLHEGRYKIKEGLSYLRHYRRTVDKVDSAVRHGVKLRADENLGSCMANERSMHLKKIPEIIADVLGNMILPGIAALEGDGIAPAVVAEAVKHAEAQAETLLAACEEVHARLKRGIKHEYSAMREGGSYLLALLDQAEGIALDALDLAEAAHHA